MPQVLKECCTFAQHNCHADKGSVVPSVGYSSGHSRHAIHKFGPVDDVGVVEHALLERDNNELRVGKMSLDHPAYVLCMAQIQCCIHLQNTALQLAHDVSDICFLQQRMA